MIKPPVKSYCGGKPNYCTPEETLILDRGCWERGCVAYDERDGDGVTISAEQKREWVGLTDADIAKAMHGSVEGSNMLPYQFARAIEAKLKEKNI